MGAQSSAQAQDAEPQSSMRPGWPQGQPPNMVWGSDRGLQATLQVRACARAHACTSPRPAACRRSHPAARLYAHSPDPTRLTLRAPQDGSVNDLDDALLEAVADGDSEATAALLAAGANVNHLSVQHDWASPAILATQEGSLDCLHLLLAVRSDGGGALLLAEVERPDPSASPP